jgi:hypothetical protein
MPGAQQTSGKDQLEPLPGLSLQLQPVLARKGAAAAAAISKAALAMAAMGATAAQLMLLGLFGVV